MQNASPPHTSLGALTPGVRSVATAIIGARRQRKPTPAAPLAALLASQDDAYQVQDLVARELGWLPAPGDTPCWKSGGPGRQATLTHAALPPSGVWRSPAESGAHHFNFRGIEAEIALRLARDVSPDQAGALTPEGAWQLVDAMTVSIEIVDSRWTEAGAAPALLKLADLQSHGALVLGDWQPFARRDWAAQACEVRIGNAAPQAFRGTHSLADPTWLLPKWLSHVTRAGTTVAAGTVVTTGTWCGLLMAQAGDRVRAEFEGVGSAEVQL